MILLLYNYFVSGNSSPVKFAVNTFIFSNFFHSSILSLTIAFNGAI